MMRWEDPKPERWSSVIGNAIGCLAIAALFGIVLLVWTSVPS